MRGPSVDVWQTHSSPAAMRERTSAITSAGMGAPDLLGFHGHAWQGRARAFT
jgi:hypothetical protein